jgi:hypothetical protein
MALPTTGSLSFNAIATELKIPFSNVSLRNMSNMVGFSTPDIISEFYGLERSVYVEDGYINDGYFEVQYNV